MKITLIHIKTDGTETTHEEVVIPEELIDNTSFGRSEFAGAVTHLPVVWHAIIAAGLSRRDAPVNHLRFTFTYNGIAAIPNTMISDDARIIAKEQQ